MPDGSDGENDCDDAQLETLTSVRGRMRGETEETEQGQLPSCWSAIVWWNVLVLGVTQIDDR